VDLWDKIDGFAKRNGLIAGVCEAGQLIKHKTVGCGAPFVKSFKNQNDPVSLISWCRSVIVAGVGRRGRCVFANDAAPRGVFSNEAIGIDYHVLLKNKLTELINYLSEYSIFNYRIFADTGPFYEKPLMIEAGLGWLGKNTLVCSDTYGSFFNAGYILTDIKIDFEVNKTAPKCGGWRKCAEAFPGGALSENG